MLFIDLHSTGIDSLEAVAAIAGTSPAALRPSYDQAMTMYNLLGRIEGLREIAHMQINHLQWVMEHNAFTYPLEVSAVEVWNHMYEIMQMPGYQRMTELVSVLTGGQPFLIMGWTPEEITRFAMRKLKFL